MKREFEPRIKEKRWSIEIEKELIKKWESEGLFKFVYDPSKQTLIIDTPPPYLSGKPHVGQAAHYVQIDMVARAYRMLGYNVLVPFYGDRNGLPVEVYVERTYNINPHEMAKTPEGREKFLELCKKYLDKVEEEFIAIWRRLGCSFEYWREGTDSPEYRKITQATFIDLWRRGLIYEAERPVMWCPRCKTAIAEAEIEYKEEIPELYYIKFKVKDSDEEIVIATTRPELLAACLVLAYNPEDSRYKHLKGRKAIVPLYNHEVEIIEHPAVDMEFGTGIMMFCSYGDQSDVRVIRELGLEPRVIIDKDGRMKPEAGPIAGLSVKDARRKIVELLKDRGYIVKVEKISRRVPTCWRCGTPVEFVHTREYFLKQLEFREKLKELAEQMKFYPPEHKKKLIDWIDSLAMDWPISRSRYYATEIPVWRCSVCGAILVPEPGKYYQPWKEQAPWEKCPQCGAPRDKLVGETRVFDTWFDSSISVLYAAGITKYPDIFKLYVERKALALRPQGIDIIRTWLYYALLRIYLLYNRPAFDMVRLNGMGLDEKGEAMHKSKGNVIYPEAYIEKYGADAFRYWSAAAAKLGSDYRFSEQMLRTGMLFVNKLWNIARFVSAFPQVSEVPKLVPTDLAILGVLNDVLRKVRKMYKELDVYGPVHEVYHFVWDVFADHYIELVKSRAYNFYNEFTEEEQRSAWYTLHTVLRTVLLMLAPIMPFITDYLWRQLYGSSSIHLELIPEPNPAWDTEYAKMFSKVMEINHGIWSYKKSKGMRLSEPLNAILYVPKDIEVFAKDLKHLHKVAEIRVGVPSVSNAIEIAKDVYLVVL
ncbi:MAG TPA: valine--tRNA ligase [Ignisphaera aggregans]|uniref:Valine--tRNA ligase n=1 Tax=Ignisphaera aggregans TaxID=334771 RepID=A0A832Z0E3_9CREN|nr:valine--tRNA ligase [Ignisphaera aggregans]